MHFIPLNKLFLQGNPGQLSLEDTARLFLYCSRHPSLNESLLASVTDPAVSMKDDYPRSIHSPTQARAIKHIYQGKEKGLVITYPGVRIDNQRFETVAGIYLSLQSGKWIVTRVRTLENEGIVEAIKAFQAEIK